jgi:putative ubiquitin-RnfH superfamily antitoxin RatB of RatAB toxin-antitoxin module
VNEQIEIEVVYALPHEQIMRQLHVPAGTMARQAVELSGISGMFPEIDLSQSRLGIFGKLVKPETILRDRDRVEVYRPLSIDPKEARRKRAEEAKAQRNGAPKTPHLQ